MNELTARIERLELHISCIQAINDKQATINDMMINNMAALVAKTKQGDK